MLRCLQLARWEHRGRPVPPHLWVGLPLVVALLSWLLLLEGLIAEFVNHRGAPPYTYQQKLAMDLCESLVPAIQGSCLSAAALFWSALWSIRHPPDAARCLCLGAGMLVVAAALSAVQHPMAALVDTHRGLDTTALLLPLALFWLLTQCAVLALPDRRSPWRGFTVGRWAPASACAIGLLSVMAVWGVHVLGLVSLL